MSREQVNVFAKFRNAEDEAGDLAWASRMGKKAMQMSPAAPGDLEDHFELTDAERVLWRLLRVPRRYIDLERAGVLGPEDTRRVLRGFVSAEVVDVVEGEHGKWIVPMEISRLGKALRGASSEPTSAVRRKARVYRPEIGLDSTSSGEVSTPSAAPAEQVTARASEAATAHPAVDPAAKSPSMQISAKRPASPTASTSSSAPTTSAKGSMRDRLKEMGRSVSVEDAALRRRIEEIFATQGTQNHYQFLGVPMNAGPVEIKQAYLKLARELHPDTLAGTAFADDPDLQHKLEKLFGRLQEANRVLTGAEERKRYDLLLANDPSGGHGADKSKRLRRPDEAQVLFKKAEHYAKAKDFVQAERHYKMALDFDDQSVQYTIQYAWCQYLNPQRDKAKRVLDAVKLLKTLVERGQPDAAWKLALIAQAEHKEEDYLRWVKKTLELSPKHLEAARAQRLIQMRQSKEASEAPKKTRGLLDRLRGR